MKNQRGTTYKNFIIFERLLYGDSNFYDDLRRLAEKWNPSNAVFTGGKPLDDCFKYDSAEELEKRHKAAVKKRGTFNTKLWDKGILGDYGGDIYALLKQYHLGEEWFFTISDVLISGWLHPPIHNVAFEFEGTGYRKRVILTLNPDTSLADIKKIWPDIQAYQEATWPLFKKTVVTDEAIENHNAAIQDRYLRRHGRLPQDQAQAPPGKLTDEDIAGIIWKYEKDDSRTADEKRKVRLRQIRKRARHHYDT